ncbi:MAG TPA: DUF3592 domain-containing protein [Actinomycetes bacterium]
MLLDAYGVVLLLIFLHLVQRTRERLKSSAQAQGTVVGVEKTTGSLGDQPRTYYHLRVRFTTPDGRTVVLTSAIGFDIQSDVGDPIPVRYSPDNPWQAEVDHPLVWMPAAIALLGGLGFLVAGIVVYLQE